MPQRSSSPWRAVVSLVWPARCRYGALTAAVAVASGMTLTGPVILRTIIDRAAAGAALSQLTWLAAGFLALAIATQAVNWVVAWLATSSAWLTANDLRLRLAEHVLGLDHEFHRSHRPGELIQRIDGDVTSVSDFLSTVVTRVLSSAVMVVGIVAVVTVIDWRLGLGMAAFGLLAMGLLYGQRNVAVAEATDEMRTGASLYGGIEERLAASEDLRANGATDYAMWRFVEDSIGHIGAVLRREVAFLRLWRGLNGAIVLGSVLSLLVGAVGVQRGFLTIGTAFLLFQYSQMMRRPLEAIIEQLEVVQKASGGMVRVAEILAQRSRIVDAGPAGRSPAPGPLAVAFDRVSFDYGDGNGNGEPVLRDVTLELGAGRSIGVIGHTGGGKTTLSRLVARLVEADEGQVRLGGVPIEQIPIDELRHRVAMVLQTVDLLEGTIRDNVTLYNPGPSDAEVDHALACVGLDRFRGPAMHHRLGPGGTGLSAGEAQLLALARVWLHDPDLVVLDEPTARVDPATEARIERAIGSLLAGRTALVIAHRLSTLRRMDEIVVIERGQVTEHGDRHLLDASASSRYRELLSASGEDEEVLLP